MVEGVSGMRCSALFAEKLIVQKERFDRTRVGIVVETIG